MRVQVIVDGNVVLEGEGAVHHRLPNNDDVVGMIVKHKGNQQLYTVEYPSLVEKSNED